MVEKVQKSEAEWRSLLTPTEFAVLREAGTERPWSGEYVSTHTEGTYHCRACDAVKRDPTLLQRSTTLWVSGSTALRTRVPPSPAGALALTDCGFNGSGPWCRSRGRGSIRGCGR